MCESEVYTYILNEYTICEMMQTEGGFTHDVFKHQPSKTDESFEQIQRLRSSHLSETHLHTLRVS